MVALTQLTVAASVVAGTLAAPAAGPQPRSPHVLSPMDDAPDFEIGAHNLARRQDYNQNWKAGQGNIQYSPSSNGYSVTFSGAGDFVVGKGWRTGTDRNITFNGQTTATAGTVLVSVYGWTRNPLIEYYVQEYTSNGKGSAQGQRVGSLESDGSTYEIWKHQQVNQPSIAGTSTFWQYISNRVTKRPGSGTVTLSNHFAAWKKAGLNLGSHDYQVLATEGWGNAGGNSKYTISTGAGGSPGGGSPPAQPPKPPPSQPPPRPTTTTARPPPVVSTPKPPPVVSTPKPPPVVSTPKPPPVVSTPKPPPPPPPPATTKASSSSTAAAAPSTSAKPSTTAVASTSAKPSSSAAASSSSAAASWTSSSAAASSTAAMSSTAAALPTVAATVGPIAVSVGLP